MMRSIENAFQTTKVCTYAADKHFTLHYFLNVKYLNFFEILSKLALQLLYFLCITNKYLTFILHLSNYLYVFTHCKMS